MYIANLQINNFRNFNNASFQFEKGINTLIGENSSGKSNALYAMRLLLDDSLPMNASKLIETDFSRSLDNWRGHWIIMKMTFNELDTSEASSMLAHITEGMDVKESSGTYNLYFRPKKKTRAELHKHTESDGNRDNLEELLSRITIDDYEVAYAFRGSANFNNPDVYKTLIGNFEDGIFPNPEDDDTLLLGNITPHISLVRREVSCTFVQALRNVVSELKKRQSSPLLNLLRGTAKEIKISETQEIQQKVKILNEDISNLGEIQDLTKNIKESLNRTLGLTYAPHISIKSELPEEIETLLHSLTLWVGDDKDSNQGKLEDLSLGGANLIYITLKLLEYEYYQPSEEKAAHFLLIEEPEAHIHTHIQKTLFDKYQFENTQVIITTHSTHISSASKIKSVNVLIKEKQETKVCQPSNNLLPLDCTRIERYLDATRTTLLFAKGVILVEGDAELILIPAMFKALYGISLDEIGISVINMSSTVFEHIAKLFDNDRLHRMCSIITDLDVSIEKLPDNEKDDTKEQRDARNSQISGEGRRINLDAIYSSNPWVQVNYAPHTFEIDFILSGNEHELIKTLPHIYSSRKDFITSSRAKLVNKDSIIKSKEVLRLAKKEGKGWFSLLLSEQLSTRTIMPQYILEAIAFTSEHITFEHLKAMAIYRINKELEYEDSSITIEPISTLDEISLSELTTIIRDYDETDDLLQLISLLGVEIEHV